MLMHVAKENVAATAANCLNTYILHFGRLEDAQSALDSVSLQLVHSQFMLYNGSYTPHH